MPTAGAPGSPKVLLVEDEADILGMLSSALEADDFEVLATADPAEALGILEREADVQMLVTDVLMPVIDGLTLSHRAVALHPGLRVVYVSGYAGELWQTVGPVPGAQVVTKPFRMSVLLAAIDRLLDRRS